MSTRTKPALQTVSYDTEDFTSDGMARTVIDLFDQGVPEDNWHLHQDVSGGGNYATFVVECEGEVFNVAIARVQR